MPYLKLSTNVSIAEAKAGELLKQLSFAVADVTGKPESVVQVAVAGGLRMYMDGSEEPTAHVEVKGINFTEDRARPMSEAVCKVLAAHLGIAGPRVYIAFDSYQGAMWGVNGRTF